MARVTGNGADAAEVVLIDVVYHRQHSARRYLQRCLVGEFSPGTDAFGDVTVDAIQAERGGKHTHGVHEFIDGNTFEDVDFLEDFFSHRRPLRLCTLTRLAVRQRDEQQARRQ